MKKIQANGNKNQCPEKMELRETLEMDTIDRFSVKIDFRLPIGMPEEEGEGNHYKQIVLPDCKTLQMGQQRQTTCQRPRDIDGGFDFPFHFSSDWNIKNIKNKAKNERQRADKRDGPMRRGNLLRPNEPYLGLTMGRMSDILRFNEHKKENDDIFGFYAYRSLLVHLHK